MRREIKCCVLCLDVRKYVTCRQWS